MKFHLDAYSELPNYLQLEQQIKTACLQGKLKPGDQLPSIRSLAKELNIAIITVKRAYDDLEKEKVIELRQGKGCFIRHVEKHKLKHEAAEQIEQEITQLIYHAEALGVTETEIKEILIKKLSEFKEEQDHD